MWTADSTQITADQTCWTADGYNGCDGGHAGSGYPVIIYETLPEKTLKTIVEKVKKYQEIEKQELISPEAIEAIAESMADTWKQEEMQGKMKLHGISQERAILSYKKTIESLINNEEDLVLILILASI